MTSHLPGHRRTPGTDPYLPGHGDDTYDVESYALTLDYRVATNRLDGEAEVTLVTRTALDRFELDLRGLEVSKVLVQGRRPAKYVTRGGRLRIQLVEAVPESHRLVVFVRYGGQPSPVRSAWGHVGWEELSDGVIVAGQPAGAPSWFPCNDRPGDKARYRITVTTESGYTVAANGQLADHRRGASRSTWVFDQQEPMASYLATVQIGQYQWLDLPDSGVPQHLLAGAGVANAARLDLSEQPQMLSLFAELFGPYPFPAYTVVVTDDELEIPLEAQGLSIFGSNHLDGSGQLNRLVAHELAHQWFGNSLTVRRWSDIWLHEGFACYAEWLWSEHSGRASAHSLASKHHAELADLDQDLVVADPGIDLMFDDRLYKRGALVLHALRADLGDGAFFAMLREWVQDHRFGSISTELFEEHTRRHGATDGLLAAWIHHPALPELDRA